MACNNHFAAVPQPQVNYAESSVECRRALLMHHFGESSFGPEQCRETCDVCQANKAADRKVEGARAALIPAAAVSLQKSCTHLVFCVAHVSVGVCANVCAACFVSALPIGVPTPA
jgi:superfamily II DNA helicase RecQ